MMADSLMGRALSDLSMKHMFEQIPCMSLVLSDKWTESRSWMRPPKDGQKRSNEIRHRLFMFLTGGGSCTRSVASR